MRLRLFTRMALILALGLLAAQSVGLWLHWGERSTVVAQTRGQYLIDRIAEVVRVLESEEPMRRPQAMAALQAGDLQVTPIDARQIFPHAPRGGLQAALNSRLGGEREMRMAGGGMGGGMGSGMGYMGGYGRHGEGRAGGAGGNAATTPDRAFDIRLDDGQWIRITASRDPAPPALPTDYLIYWLFSLAVVVGVVILAVRQATRPLRQLAEAADAFGHRLDAPPLAEAGPAETRQAAQAFNRMQYRIRHLVDERARALAAISHDLRTPLTRLRLRAELVGDTFLREQMANDLDAMAAMIDSTLDYLRGLQEDEPSRPIDINALLQSLAEDAGVTGHTISVEGTAHAPYVGRLTALRRALQNLIDNAVRYGQNPHLRIEDDTHCLQLIVEDDGPGIPPAELARVTTPYYRPDISRNSGTGGVGLGLSIVSDVARRHGGELRLDNRPEGGLQAALILPRIPGK